MLNHARKTTSVIVTDVTTGIVTAFNSVKEAASALYYASNTINTCIRTGRLLSGKYKLTGKRHKIGIRVTIARASQDRLREFESMQQASLFLGMDKDYLYRQRKLLPVGKNNIEIYPYQITFHSD